MIRIADLLVTEARWVAHAATIALFALVIAIALVLGTSHLPLPAPESPLSRTIGVLLGIAMLAGLVAMIGSTMKAVEFKGRATDSGLFMLFVWLVPIIGIAGYLGIKNLRSSNIGD